MNHDASLPGSHADGPPRVALDLRRWIEHGDASAPVRGITRYVKALAVELAAASDRLRLVPCVSSDPAFRSNLYHHDLRARELAMELGVDLVVQWPRPSDPAPTIHGAIESLASRLLGAAAAQRLLDRVLSPARAGRLRRRHARRRALPDAPALRYRPAGAEDAPWQLYHSPYHPMPDRAWTGPGPRVVTIADCIYLRHPELDPGHGRAAIGAILDSIDPARDHVIAISHATAADVVACRPIAPERIHVVPLAYEPVFAVPDVAAARPLLDRHGMAPGRYVLALGQPNPRKNLARLAAAWLRLRQTGRAEGLSLLLVAHADDRARVAAALSSLAAPPGSWTFLEDVDDRMLASLYANARAFAYVPLFEGFGLPLLEAMAAGCPVLASDAAALREVAGEAALFAAPLDVEAIGEGLGRLLTESSLREALIEKGRRHATHYSWRRTAEQTIDVYDTILRSS